MRARLFIDGRHLSGPRSDLTGEAALDYSRLGSRLARHAGPRATWKAFLYRSAERNPSTAASPKASDELPPRYTVREFARVNQGRECPLCDTNVRFSVDKRLNTSLVADMVCEAGQDRYDTAIVVGSDIDFEPGFNAVRQLGKQVLLATWKRKEAPNALIAASDGYIDLSECLKELVSQAKEAATEATPSELPDEGPQDKAKIVGRVPPVLEVSRPVRVGEEALSKERREDPRLVVLEELVRALRMHEHYVGFNDFVEKFNSDRMPRDRHARQRYLDWLKERGLIETYTAIPSGDLAIRFPAK